MSETVEVAADATPLMKQYAELKAQAGDALLLFRMGDFYELFGDDALTAARVLEITLTSRDKNKPNPVPMAGVPHHSVQGYIQKLLKSGFKVAIGEQIEDPEKPTAKVSGKTIVRRAITRVFTPGVHFDHEGAEANFIAAVVALEGGRAGKRDVVLACVDASTGEALVSEPCAPAEARLELAIFPIRHLVHLSTNLAAAELAELSPPASVLVEALPQNYASVEQARETLKRHYEVSDLSAYLPGEPGAQDAKTRALGVLVSYVLRTQQQERLSHLRVPVPLHRPRALVLGPRTAQHLDLVPDASGITPSLFGFLNRTRSALGARCLKRWLLQPLLDPTEIRTRQSMVREIAAFGAFRTDTLASQLAEVYDIERICGRINAALANPRDTRALGVSLSKLPGLADSLRPKEGASALTPLREELVRLCERLRPWGERILREQREDAPFVAREGGVFNPGVDAELDRLLGLTSEGSRWLIELEARERATTGIPSLKVRYNRVFGYYIEVTQAHLKNVPAHYQRKQTTVGAERFFTEELKRFEEEILTAGTKQKSLEQELFEKLVAELRAESPALMDAARVLGELDALLALSRLAPEAGEAGWCFPEIDESLALSITQGRHPLVDQSSGGKFVPNDLELRENQESVLVITGPNMGGKSTVMRQCALIVILGQMGAPVPARAARWGAVSSLYTRIGAHDAIARGQSTFMVEMSELAHILHHADRRSLIILDEIGRGTSTYDGISVAWGALEWIASRIQARTLFATHYHELTQLEGRLPLLANAHLAVDGGRDARDVKTLRFLYELRQGPASESFGIHVAKLAGLPKPLIDRAWKVLENLEAQHLAPGAGRQSAQLSLFAAAAPSHEEEQRPLDEPAPAANPRAAALLEALEGLDTNRISPLEALNWLAARKAELGAPSGRTPDAAAQELMN